MVVENENPLPGTEALRASSDRFLREGVCVEMQLDKDVLRIQTGVMARQAHGSVVVTYGDSMVLVAASCARPTRVLDFFPLTVEYREKTAAAGKFPGGFIKREGRPSQKEILTCRCMDRPIRPLFPAGYMDEVQVVASVLSADPEKDPDVLAMIGSFAALHISRIPFQGPGASVRVGQVDGQLVLFPTESQRKTSTMDLIVSGLPNSVTMVEAGARGLPEEELLRAIEFGHRWVAKISQMVDELRAKAGVPKDKFVAPARDESLLQRMRTRCWEELRGVILSPGKHAQQRAIEDYRSRIVEEFLAPLSPADPLREEQERKVKSCFSELVSERMRRLVLDHELRADGRGLRDVRPISIHLGVLPRVHGSALFTRGETQSLASLTLGSQSDGQLIDGLGESYRKRFYLDYNFPPFSVGEVKPVRGPGRREVGHGLLAERALQPLLPDAETFPYTIRLISDILESNGSSSMASVCSGSLALMQAGVPIREAVAGIAMGLITDGTRYKVLSDIQGLEDHEGDMDFKVAGTKAGVTALQMDLKVQGISFAVMAEALEQARQGRLHILAKMESAIANPNSELSPHAPRILRRVIPVDKIGMLIGPGGKNIRMIQEKTGTAVEVNDSGEVLISGPTKEAIETAARMVETYTLELRMGEWYEGKVVDIREFGVFVELAPGQEALCHISSLSVNRINDIHSVVKLGDVLRVRIINIDPSGKVKVSALAEGEERSQGPPPRRSGDGPQGRGGRFGGRDGGGEGRDHHRPQGGGHHQ